MSLNSILLILALVCFVVSACGVSTRINLQSLGLALWVAALLIAPR